MGLTEGRGPKTVWANPAEIIRSLAPENPVMAFAPSVLRATAQRFLQGFPGLVTYAVKSNPDEAVIRTLLHNAEVAKSAVANAIALLAGIGPSQYANAMRDALITHKAAVPARAVENTRLIVGKYFEE